MTAPTLPALRQELAKAHDEAFTAYQAMPIDDQHGWRDYMLAAVEPVVARALTEAWDDGRQSVGLDFLNPLDEKGQRAQTNNPFASGDTTNGENERSTGGI